VKAVWVESFGGVEALRVAERPQPEPGPGEVRLDVRACGVNFADLLQRQGSYPGGPRPPFTPGLEAAGVVEAVGPDTSAPEVGTRVVALAPGGLQAERAVVRSGACWAWPEALSFEQGAAFPVSYLTAYAALALVARAEKGEIVLVHAAAGALGRAAVRVARCLGLTVVGTASTAEKRALALAAGAHHVADYEEFPKVLREVGGGRGADVVVDGVAGPLLSRTLASLAPLGRHVVVGFSGGAPPPIDAGALLFRSRGVLGFHLDALARRQEAVAAAARRLLAWIEEGSLAVEAAHRLRLDEVGRAHELLATRANLGKVVLVP
jgi:NADPH2:quinone reductase